MAFEAYSSALDDADIESSEIDGSVVCSATHYDKQRSPAGVVAEYLGLNPQPTFNVEAACASSAVGLRTAWALISSRLHDMVAVVGMQKMTELSSEEIQELMGRAGDVMWESPFGTTMPAYYAAYANAHMARFGTTEEQKMTITRQMKQGFIFLSPLLYQHKPEFWHLPADFDKVDQEMEEAARDAGLGVLTLEEKVKFWKEAIEKKRSEIEEMGIKVPAIPELGVEGEVVQVKKNETIATSF